MSHLIWNKNLPLKHQVLKIEGVHILSTILIVLRDGLIVLTNLLNKFLSYIVLLDQLIEPFVN